MKSKTDEERLAELEISLAHLERRYDALSEVIFEQGKTIHRLQTQIRRLTDTVEQQELDRVRSVTTRPPHHQP